MIPPCKPFSLLLCAALLGLPTLASCASTSPYVWVSDLPQARVAGDYVIATGDVLAIKVFNQENMSTRARVRSDGKIALPFLGDVAVRGKSPAAVSKELARRLAQYVISPGVTITVEETLPTSVSVLGEVTRPGLYTVEESAGVLQALAVAGGLTDYASHESIYVMRRTPAQRIRFTYASLTDSQSPAATFRLRAGDVLVVE